jgi:hypothetical protein
MAQVVFFFPWAQSVVSEDQLPSDNWMIHGAVAKGYTYRQVYWSGTVNTQLADLTDQTIYVRGHGAADSDTISPRDDTADNSLKPAAVANALRSCGLKTSYTGKLKLYNCYSAISFGPKFVELMRAIGYVNCEYYGYTVSVNQAYVTVKHLGQTHKYLTRRGPDLDFTMGSPYYRQYPVWVESRASEVRVQL